MLLSPLPSYEDNILSIYAGNKYFCFTKGHIGCLNKPFLGQADFTGTMHPHFKHSIFLPILAWICVFMLFIYTFVCVREIHTIYIKIYIHTVCMYSVFLMYTLHCARENCTTSCWVFTSKSGCVLLPYSLAPV